MKQRNSLLLADSARQKLQIIEKRCAANGIKFGLWEYNDDEVYKVKLIKPGFSDLNYFISKEKDLDVLIGTPFENIAGLNALTGYVDVVNSVIEVPIMGAGIFGSIDKNKLFGAERSEVILESPSSGSKIRIGLQSEFCSQLRNGDGSDLSVILYGQKVTTAEEAESQIKGSVQRYFSKFLTKKTLA